MSGKPDTYDSADTEAATGIFLLDRASGEVRPVPDDFAAGANWWWWAHGNGSCDCNRASAFGVGAEVPCGDWRFVVVHPDGVPRAGFNDAHDLTGLPAEGD